MILWFPESMFFYENKGELRVQDSHHKTTLPTTKKMFYIVGVIHCFNSIFQLQLQTASGHGWWKTSQPCQTTLGHFAGQPYKEKEAVVGAGQYTLHWLLHEVLPRKTQGPFHVSLIEEIDPAGQQKWGWEALAQGLSTTALLYKLSPVTQGFYWNSLLGWNWHWKGEE